MRELPALLILGLASSSGHAQSIANSEERDERNPEIRHETWLTELEDLRRQAGLFPAQHDLPQGPLISGRVVNHEGDPVRTRLQVVFFPSEDLVKGPQTQNLTSIVTDENGVFSYQTPCAGRLVLSGNVNNERFSQTIEDVTAETDVEFVVDAPSIDEDLEPEYPVRRVAIKITPPAGFPRPLGMVRVQVRQGDGTWETPEIRLVHGRADLEVRGGPRADRMQVRVIGLAANGLTLPVNHRHQFSIADREEPTVIEVEPVPAGAIHGRVLDPAGSPVVGATIMPMIRAQARGGIHFQGLPGDQSLLETDDNGWFLVYPVPLGSTVLLTVRDDPETERRVISEMIDLSAQQPIATTSLALPDGIDVPLRIRDARGEPVVETPIRLSWQTLDRMPLGGSQLTTDSNGEAVLLGVNEHLNAQVTAIVAPGEDHPGLNTSIRLIGEPIVLNLPEGMVIRGVVLNALTGEPIADATIQANPRRRRGQPHAPTARLQTQSDGTFEFTNLIDASYTLNVSDHWPVGTIRTEQSNGRFRFRSNTAHPLVDSERSPLAPAIKLQVLLAEDVPIEKPETAEERRRVQVQRARAAERAIEAQRNPAANRRLQDARRD